MQRLVPHTRQEVEHQHLVEQTGAVDFDVQPSNKKAKARRDKKEADEQHNGTLRHRAAVLVAVVLEALPWVTMALVP